MRLPYGHQKGHPDETRRNCWLWPFLTQRAAPGVFGFPKEYGVLSIEESQRYSGCDAQDTQHSSAEYYTFMLMTQGEPIQS